MAKKNTFQKILPKHFPPMLREIPDPPEKLYLEGELPSHDEYKYLSVVGSRKFSNYGKEACEHLIGALAGLPIVIASGLAVGIDTIAHKAALATGLKTLAIPGSGLDRSVLHPSSNRPLADEIIECGGALLSELDPTQPAGVHTFPSRNRIMAGLCHAVLIIEAAERSGTLITARLAMEYNRDVFVVPAGIFSPAALGSNKLIKNGAHPILSGDDLIQALGFETDDGSGQAKIDFDALSKSEKKIVEIISREPLPKEELIMLSGLKASEANTLLTAMELKGLIVEKLGEVRMA